MPRGDSASSGAFLADVLFSLPAISHMLGHGLAELSLMSCSS